MGEKRSPRPRTRHAFLVLEFFAKHRIAMAGHVQRRFPKLFPTDRTTRMHLQTLVASRELSVTQQHSAGLPNVYQITGRGLRTVAEQEGSEDDLRARVQRIARSRVPHELLITEFATALEETARRRGELSIGWQERIAFTQQPSFRTVIPDYGFLFQHPQGQMLCLLEVQSGEESPMRVRRKLERYAEWQESPEGQRAMMEIYRRHGAKAPRPQFRLLFVVEDRRTGNDEARLRQVFSEAVHLPSSLRRRIWAATVSDLLEAANVDSPVWRRGTDLERAIGQWQGLVKRKRRRFVASLVRSMERHTLFPESTES